MKVVQLQLMWVANLLPWVLAAPTSGNRGCLCLAEQSCWPSGSEWDTFNSSIGGKLTVITPVGAPCHDPTFNSALCGNVALQYTNSTWRSDQIGALQQVNWEVDLGVNETCYIITNRSIPCGQGDLPVYGVSVLSASDISKTVQFATSNNLRLVIKNTGHDYLGRSTARGALAIWTHNMKNITFTEEFIPQGGNASVGTTVTIDAGVQLQDLYAAVAAQNQAVVIGYAHSVGAAGGYIQGGGHSPMGNWKGMSVDNTAEFQVVTAAGEVVIANDYQNQDLYWALRGGGGGTFGVVVSVTLKTFPEPPLVALNLNISFPDVDSMWSWVESYFATLPAIDDAGGSGYYYIDPEGQIFGTGNPSFVTLHFFFDKTNVTAINEVFAPLYQQAHDIDGTSVSNVTVALPLARYVYPQPYGSDGTGGNALLGTRLYSRNILETPSGPGKYVAAFKNITALLPAPIYQGHLTAGGQVARNSYIDSALNPSWRRALGELIIPVSWSSTTPVETQNQLRDLLTNTLVPILAAVEPDMGAYTNEANAYEPHWQTVFWGYKYLRLWEVKEKWDPSGVFRCNRCVGSEKWDANTALNCPAY